MYIVKTNRTELRDNDAYLYFDYLPVGVYIYQIQAMILGKLQVLPAHAYAFYMPDIWRRTAGLEFVIKG